MTELEVLADEAVLRNPNTWQSTAVVHLLKCMAMASTRPRSTPWLGRIPLAVARKRETLSLVRPIRGKRA